MKHNISFIIPAFNCEDTLSEAVDSIYSNNFNNGDEVIIVDDCSTDLTNEVIRKLESKYPNIVSIKHQKNLGGGSARNTAVSSSKNSLIFCLDSDNFLARNSINNLRNTLIHSKYHVAAFDTIKFFKQVTFFKFIKYKKYTHAWTYKDVHFSFEDYLNIKLTPGYSGNYLYTKESWIKSNGYPEDCGALDTWGFGLRQAAHGYEIKLLKDSYYFHRYGYDSYWVRDKDSLNDYANIIIKPFYNYIHKSDIDLVKENPSWFQSIEDHKIRSCL